ncbi:MAG: (Fe-S)-binding protein, partial [Gammaproteobacteria bacterium]|nr:(Fe-S)-binding protein [Gammaproteobacteria bacterium]
WNQIVSYSPRRILRQLALETGTEASVDQAVWSCATCNACTVNCPRGIEIIDVIKAVRTLNVTGGRIPASFEAPLDSLKANGNPWDGVRAKRLEWAGDLDLPAFTSEHEYCLFTCCTTAYDPGNRIAGRALTQLLKYAGIAFGTFGAEESCCGDPAHKLGADKIFSELTLKNTDLFLRAGVQKILTTSPHCLNAFSNNYDGLKGSVASEHYTELLDRLVTQGHLTPTLEVPATVTYHDPCYLGRYQGIYAAPRRVLQSIPGLTLIEMASHKESSLCCGGGGGGAWADTPLNRRLDALRVEEALSTGAQIIATACPFCLRMLNNAVKSLGVGDRIGVRDLAELLLQSLTLKDKAKMTERVDLEIDREICHV